MLFPKNDELDEVHLLMDKPAQQLARHVSRGNEGRSCWFFPS
jgi:hypothetical protein